MAVPAQRRDQVSVTIVEKSKKPTARKPRNKKKPHPNNARGPSLSPCVRDYASALVDPFDGPLACVPSSFPPIPSFKVRVWNRGFATVGTAGVGFVTVKPSSVVTSDGLAIAFSGSTYASAGLPTTFAETGVTNVATNAPFAVASFGETTLGTQYRLVSCGVRVWYQDTELNLGGEMLGIRQPDNQTVAGLTYTQVQGFTGTRRVRVASDRAPLDVTWVPVKPSELEYNGTFTNLPSMAVLFSATNGVKFGYEVYAIVEYIGYSVPNKTPSHADPAGFAAVLTAAQTDGDSWYGDARDAANSLLSKASQVAAGLTGSRIGNHVLKYAEQWAMNKMGFPSLSVLPDSPPPPPPTAANDPGAGRRPLPLVGTAPTLPKRPTFEQSQANGDAARVWAAYDSALAAYADYWGNREGGEAKVAEADQLFHG